MGQTTTLPASNQIEVRKRIYTSEFIGKFSPAEQSIFKAATRPIISELSEDVLKKGAYAVLKQAAFDTGFKIPENIDEWKFICDRLIKIFKQYYKDLTLWDIATAFELLSVGQLDEFLPKNLFNEPDKGHYQQFNVDYFAKILNAYKKKRDALVIKSRQLTDKPAEPKLLNAVSDLQIKKDIVNTCFDSYVKDKKLPQITAFSEIAIIEVLNIDNPIVSDEDLEASYNKLLADISAGLVNKYNASHLKTEGHKSRRVQSEAESIARKKVIKQAFDTLIKEGKRP